MTVVGCSYETQSGCSEDLGEGWEWLLTCAID